MSNPGLFALNQYKCENLHSSLRIDLGSRIPYGDATSALCGVGVRQTDIVKYKMMTWQF